MNNAEASALMSALLCPLMTGTISGLEGAGWWTAAYVVVGAAIGGGAAYLIFKLEESMLFDGFVSMIMPPALFWGAMLASFGVLLFGFGPT